MAGVRALADGRAGDRARDKRRARLGSGACLPSPQRAPAWRLSKRAARRVRGLRNAPRAGMAESGRRACVCSRQTRELVSHARRAAGLEIVNTHL